MGCDTCPSRRDILEHAQSDEGLVDTEQWTNDWSRSMCEMAGDCPGPGCRDCMARMTDRVESSPGGLSASRPAGRVASVISKFIP